MEIVLLEDVKSLGKKDQVVKVSDGYARNYLLPRKLGIQATPKNLNDLKQKKEHEEKTAARQLKEAKELAAKIGDNSITVTLKAGEGGRTFGSVSAKEIAQAILNQLGIEIDKKKIAPAEPIKNLGDTEVPIKLHKDVTAKLIVHVTEA